jgi:hypothetical protein
MPEAKKGRGKGNWDRLINRCTVKVRKRSKFWYCAAQQGDYS